MFADGFVSFVQMYVGGTLYWMRLRLMQNCMKLFSNGNKTVCMTFKAKSAKSTVIPLLTLDGQSVKSVSHHKYSGIVLYTELSDDKDIQRQLRYQYCAGNKLRAS